MFRKVSIVRLVESQSLLDFSLDWPKKVSRELAFSGNIDLLRYAAVIKGNISSLLSENNKAVKTVIIPIHYINGHQNIKWISDLSHAQYRRLTESLQSVMPKILTSDYKQCWYLKNKATEIDLSDQCIIDVKSPFARSLQEIEMMLYAHPVNQNRQKHRQLTVNGIMLGFVDGSARVKKVFSDAGFLSLIAQPNSIKAWIDNPVGHATLVLGDEVGGQTLFQIKETLLQMMESGFCDRVEIIEPNKHVIYSCNKFSQMYTQIKNYFFTKQAM